MILLCNETIELEESNNNEKKTKRQMKKEQEVGFSLGKIKELAKVFEKAHQIQKGVIPNPV